ncbi:adhesion G-protein coupled receptor G5-like [Plectropomus leopardus]|uniref:adhesion G-protein coupled receptor G5-like n=1 Tax=Plectropomus leopardus TaxID=160734 RepID=UPI001C4A94E6|nr:adhesion G-protein coupled receptor G5-like [Plectropomus leopardus]
MESRTTDNLRAVLFFIILFSSGLSENDLDFNFCGVWRHGKGSLRLNVNLSTGCRGISFSANESYLSIDGQVTALCQRSEVIHLKVPESEEETQLCLYWEPLLDQLKLQVGGKRLTLCWPASLQGPCCTDLSVGASTPEARYGIIDAITKNDFISHKTRTAYKFDACAMDCKALCDQERQGSTQVNMTEDIVVMSSAGRTIEHNCPYSSEVEMKEDFRGHKVTSWTTKSASAESTCTVYLPAALKQAAKNSSKVVCTFFKNNSLFQDGHRILNDVVRVIVKNEVIPHLSQPMRIFFHHDAIPETYSRKCVSWDTRRDPWQVSWLVDGCETRQKGANYTECLCNHLAYFTVLVQREPSPVRPLLALTVITSLGCAMSMISCVTLIIFLCRKSKLSKEQSIHLGSAVSLAFLHLLLFLTGDNANVGNESVCTWLGAGLHYTLLSSFTWMGIEFFHTFWLANVGFNPSLMPREWNVVGFVLPVAPIIILARVGDVYGMKEVETSDDDPYLMCWMKQTHKAMLAHYCTSVTIPATLVFSGILMLFAVCREIHTTDEWRQNLMAFLSIWGLIFLFGTTWSLTFLDFGPIFFRTCIFNSFQGFTLMLRCYMLDWMRRPASGSAPGSPSTGATREHMLQVQEES